MIDALSFLAQATTSQPAAQKPAPGFFDAFPLPLLIGMFAIMYFLMIRPQSKERKKREALLSALKKNDRVITIGGIVGTVTAVRDDEVTLKVDESSNTKITFSKAAIQKVLASNAPAAAAS
ncbi:MAG: preprotein translocase subunit YajC [Planctomycetes bacterium]|nr:preprotein translocase subunit YajC [Planctomycetota bacterium]